MSRAKTIGRPDVSPRCVACGTPFKPQYLAEWDRNKDGTLIHGSRRLVFYGWRHYNDIFCTLRCALRFATLAYRAGYRVK